MTDASRSIVWDASFLPFGEEDSLTGSAANDNRFPGQRLSPETGLHYNYFRDYDPTTGRYLQSDPIGLAGGINTYGYVSGNPVNYVDPTGELACGGVCIAGGLILGGIGLDILYELYENEFNTECIDWRERAAEIGLGAIIPPVFKPVKYAVKIGKKAGKGLRTPSDYFRNKTKKEASKALREKFGKPKSSREHAETYYNPKTKRSYNVHQERGHQSGKPHVDVRRRGGYRERKFDLKE